MSDDDDFSDLTDLSDEEDEETAPSSSQAAKRKGKKKDAVYQLRNPLRVPRATTYAAQALFGESRIPK